LYQGKYTPTDSFGWFQEKVMQYPMPMPIPKPTSVGDIGVELHSMSFIDAQEIPFTNPHQQPSLAATLSTRLAKKKQRRRLLLPISKLGPQCIWIHQVWPIS
jgi:hypothetical protein